MADSVLLLEKMNAGPAVNNKGNGKTMEQIAHNDGLINTGGTNLQDNRIWETVKEKQTLVRCIVTL